MPKRHKTKGGSRINLGASAQESESTSRKGLSDGEGSAATKVDSVELHLLHHMYDANRYVFRSANDRIEEKGIRNGRHVAERRGCVTGERQERMRKMMKNVGM